MSEATARAEVFREAAEHLRKIESEATGYLSMATADKNKAYQTGRQDAARKAAQEFERKAEE